MDKKQNVIKLPIPEQPIDLVISNHIRNMFATYGEEKVRNSLKELFSIPVKKSKKSA